MPDAQKHFQASLYPSEVVTIAILFALKGVGIRAFYRWLKRAPRPLFPHLPHGFHDGDVQPACPVGQHPG